MAVFNFAQYFRCIPSEGSDPETGCKACGENARSEYEQCRQTYFLEKQAENTKLISENQNNEFSSEIKTLQQENNQLKLQILEQQNINNGLEQNQQQYESSISLLTSLIFVSFIFGGLITYIVIKLKRKLK